MRRRRRFISKGIGSVNALLRWLYTGRLDLEISCAAENAMEMIGLAESYGLPKLKRMCENLVVNGVNIKNVITTLKAADRFGAQNLKQHTLNYLLKYFDQVAPTPEFNELAESPALLLEVTKASATRYSSVTHFGGSGSSF